MRIFLADFRLAVLLTVRSKFWLIAGALIILVAAGAWLSSLFSPRQPATVALDVGLSLIRIMVTFVALFQVQDLLSREIERRLILNSLTYPRSRSLFVLARYAAVVAISVALTAVLALALAAAVTVAGKFYAQSTPVSLGLPYVITIIFLLLDFAVVLAFAVLLAAISTTPNLVIFGGVGFMIAARSVSTIIRLLERETDLVAGAQWYHSGLEGTHWLLPDLAAFDVRAIALYGRMEFLPQAPWAMVLMAFGYIAVLLIIGCRYFERRQFA